jgi:hypothetical protein
MKLILLLRDYSSVIKYLKKTTWTSVIFQLFIAHNIQTTLCIKTKNKKRINVYSLLLQELTSENSRKQRRLLNGCYTVSFHDTVSKYTKEKIHLA